ncbi:hypothetical protein NGRA_0949 [Nosema granulosis]|uniref:Uncharacterized protein n=1 Tax=Nosema granulosis TaxID=83296 RepID=A0A9P6L020_9MICR|nr:hypothetical protein NGRA_0949 [Nosema granulosis]
MIHRILDIVAKEDSFSLFSNNVSPSIFSILQYNLRTTKDIKTALLMFFKNVIDTALPDSLYWAEACRMYKFVNRLFQEIDEIAREGTTNDDITDCYIESISEFVEDIEVEIVKNHIHFITR